MRALRRSVPGRRRRLFAGAGRTAGVGFLAGALVAVAAAPADAQRPTAATGPVIEDFGPVYPVPDPDFSPPLDQPLQVVFDVAQASPRPDGVNPRLATLARYLNMHARAGVPRENMKLALVVHGEATWEMTDDATYRARHGVDNPNLPLLEALHDFGVPILLCGQSQASRGIERASLAPPVGVSLSAMTALVDFQARGYRLIAF